MINDLEVTSMLQKLTTMINDTIAILVDQNGSYDDFLKDLNSIKPMVDKLLAAPNIQSIWKHDDQKQAFKSKLDELAKAKFQSEYNQTTVFELIDEMFGDIVLRA